MANNPSPFCRTSTTVSPSLIKIYDKAASKNQQTCIFAAAVVNLALGKMGRIESYQDAESLASSVSINVVDWTEHVA